ncbi:unnamed protein product, partial [Choristocarpus tenellus]
MASLPDDYKDHVKVDNGVEIIWTNEKGQIMEEKGGGANADSSEEEVDEDVIVGMPQPAQLPTSQKGSRMSLSGKIFSSSLIGDWFSKTPKEPEGEPTISPEPPLDEEDEADPDGHPCMVLEPFATKYYYKERRGLLGKKRTPMETLLSWKGKQISSPLTAACRNDKSLSTEAVFSFGEIMSYMGDRRTKETGIQILKSLMKRMIEGSQVFKDEIFCQLCKQTTSNPDVNSDLRGWQLIVATLAVAATSELLKPFFIKHCEQVPVGAIPQAYGAGAVQALEKTVKAKPRKAPPCDMEIMALVQLSAVPVLVRL